jgi:hypothetical protein
MREGYELRAWICTRDEPRFVNFAWCFCNAAREPVAEIRGVNYAAGRNVKVINPAACFV